MSEPFHQGPACRVGESLESEIEGRRLVKHTLKYRSSKS
jgi:hypothetical protein